MTKPQESQADDEKQPSSNEKALKLPHRDWKEALQEFLRDEDKRSDERED